MMKRLLIATTNRAKLEEYRLLLRHHALRLISLAEAGVAGSAPEETGATFAENALLKARFYFARAGLATLADDGGLEIDALDGEPGIRSHRWINGRTDATDRDLVDEVMRRMAEIESNRRTARLRAAGALVYDEGGRTRESVAEAAIEGVIGERAQAEIRPGFPYRAVLIMPDSGRYLGELSEQEAANLSQRRMILAKLHDDLERIAAG